MAAVVLAAAGMSAAGMSVAAGGKAPAVGIGVFHLEGDQMRGVLLLASEFGSWHQQSVGEEPDVVRDPRQPDGSTGS
jgi:hypothetical protein